MEQAATTTTHNNNSTQRLSTTTTQHLLTTIIRYCHYPPTFSIEPVHHKRHEKERDPLEKTGRKGYVGKPNLVTIRDRYQPASYKNNPSYKKTSYSKGGNMNPMTSSGSSAGSGSGSVPGDSTGWLNHVKPPMVLSRYACHS